MTLYVLDTDIVGMAQQRRAELLRHLRSLAAEDRVVTTIITFGEDLTGWLPACRRATDGRAREAAYSRLQRGLEFYRRWICLPFDSAAATVFDRLRSEKLRLGTNDLAIAAITLSAEATLVTRNTVDFQRVPTLRFEDWGS